MRVQSLWRSSNLCKVIHWEDKDMSMHAVCEYTLVCASSPQVLEALRRVERSEVKERCSFHGLLMIHKAWLSSFIAPSWMSWKYFYACMWSWTWISVIVLLYKSTLRRDGSVCYVFEDASGRWARSNLYVEIGIAIVHIIEIADTKFIPWLAQ